MKDDLFIFSYGSNLLTERIRRRVGYVESFVRYRLSGYRLVFNKPGADGSAKANLSQTNDPDDSVWGVIHGLNLTGKNMLDGFEPGYNCIPLETAVGMLHTYSASVNLKSGEPYGWYLDLIIAGAIEHNFPTGYIEWLRTIYVITDSNEDRRRANLGMIHSKTRINE